VLAARDRFPGLHIPFATREQFEHVSNKAMVLSAANQLGIATPAQHTLETAADGRSADEIALQYPLVLKPSRSVVPSGNGATKVGVSHVAHAGELTRKLGMYPPEAFPILLQQRIVGPGIGVFMLFVNGEVVATSGHRRIRECPPSGGVSAYREAIVPPAALVKQSRELLDHFGWQGVAMIEYKIDEATGVPYLMEINGRFWGSLQLAVDAGVDFPRLLIESALGKRPEMPVHGADGVRSRWEWGDVNHLLARLRRSALELDLTSAAGGRGRALVDFFAWRRGDRLEVLRLGDPGPFVRETIDWLQRR
jgi:predicted ATP-grasp superfamily ATP-dependent carboligase